MGNGFYDKMTIHCEAGCTHEVNTFATRFECPYRHQFTGAVKPQPMIELDDAIAAGRAAAAATAWNRFDASMEWAARHLRRGDVLRWKTGTFAAVFQLQLALGSR